MKRLAMHVGMVLCVGMMSLSCSGSAAINIFPDTKDIELGQQLDAEIKKNPKEYPVMTDRPEVKAYVEGIGKKILNSAEVKKRGVYAYQFEIIHDDSTINAFCTPGGYIYVYTGLMKFLDNEATLAGVIAHEIAHAERRHATRRMTTALGYEIVLSLVLGERPSESAKLAANLFSGLALLKNSRGDETESDIYSFKYLRSTEYYPGAIRFFFEKVSAGRQGGSLERLLSTHPLPQDRFDQINKLLAEAGNPQPSEANLFGERYRKFQRTLPN